MRPPRVPMTLAAMVLFAATACAGTDDPTIQPDVPTFEGAIDLEIGEMDGDDPYLFTSVGDIVKDDWGRLVVADIQTSEIRVFAPDGAFEFRFGGHGEGPGELTDPCCLEFGPDGALWVRESARYSVFTLDSTGARFERVVRSPHLGQVGLMEPFAFDMAGSLVSVGTVRNDDNANVTARLHVGSDQVVDTVILADPDRQSAGYTLVERILGESSRARFFVYEPFGPLWIDAHAPDGTWAEAVTSEYSINYHNADGTVLPIEGPAIQGPSLSDDERARAQAWIDRDMEQLDLSNHPFGIPDRKPPLARMFFDRHGRLWVEKTTADGAAMREADVYEGTTLTARYRWPRRIREFPVPWATESVLYGVTADSLGVQRVARVRFTPTP